MALRPNTTYYFRVRAVNAASESPLSESIAVTTAATNALDASSVVAASTPIIYNSVVDSSSLQLYISKPDTSEYINNYQVDISTVSDFSNIALRSKVNTETQLTTTTDYNGSYYVINIDSLQSNTTYYVRVKAFNLVSGSAFSDILTTTTKQLLAVPVVAGVVDLTAITAKVVWSEVGGSSSYKLDVATNSTFLTKVVDDVTVNATEYTIPVLVENTDYFIRVKAISGSNESNYSATVKFRTLDNIATFNTLSFVPATPVLTSILNLDTTGFKITWLADATPLTYTLEIASDSSYNTIVATYITKDFEVLVNGLTADTIYYYRLKSTGYIDSSYVTGQIKTLSINIGLNAPGIVVNTLVLSTEFTVSIVQRSYATNYLVELDVNSSFTNPRKVYTVDSSVKFSDLSPVTQYYVRVKGLNSLNSSNYSSVISATTVAALPAIDLAAVSEITEHAVRLNWTRVSTYQTYILDVKKADSSLSGLAGNLFRNLDVGYVDTYLVDLLLVPDTEYLYRLTGVTASGDRKSTEWTLFSTLTPATTLSFNNGVLYWPLNGLNKIEASLSEDFRYCLPGWSPKTVTGTDKYPITSLLNTYKSVYIRGYLDDGLKQSSNTLTINTADLEFIQNYDTGVDFIKIKLNPTNTSHKLKIFKVVSSNLVAVGGYTHPITLTQDWEFVFNNLEASATYRIFVSYLDTTLGTYIDFDTISTKTFSTEDVFIDYAESLSIAATTLTVTYTGDNTVIVNTTGSLPVAIKASLWPDLPNYLYYFEGTKTQHIIETPPNTLVYIKAVAVDGNQKSEVAATTVTTLSYASEGVSALGSVAQISNIAIVNTQQAIISWGTVVGALDYGVEFSLTTSFDLLDNSLSVYRLSPTSILVSGINSTLRYYVRVQAFNRLYVGDYSNFATLDTTP